MALSNSNSKNFCDTPNKNKNKNTNQVRFGQASFVTPQPAAKPSYKQVMSGTYSPASRGTSCVTHGGNVIPVEEITLGSAPLMISESEDGNGAAAVFIVKSAGVPNTYSPEKYQVIESVPILLSWMGVIPDDISYLSLVTIQLVGDETVEAALSSDYSWVKMLCRDQLVIIDETGMVAGCDGIGGAVLPANTFSREHLTPRGAQWRMHYPHLIPPDRKNDILNTYIAECRARIIGEIYPYDVQQSGSEYATSLTAESFDEVMKKIIIAYRAVTYDMFSGECLRMSEEEWNDTQSRKGDYSSERAWASVMCLAAALMEDPASPQALADAAKRQRAASQHLEACKDIWGKGADASAIAVSFSWSAFKSYAYAGRVSVEAYVALAKACGAYQYAKAHFEHGVPIDDLFAGVPEQLAVYDDIPF